MLLYVVDQDFASVQPYMYVVNSAIVCLNFPPRKAGILLPQTEDACLCQTIIWNVAAILRDSVAVVAVVVVVVVVVVVRTRPRAIPLAMITMRKSTHGFPFLSYIGMGLRSRAFGAQELRYKLSNDTVDYSYGDIEF